MTGNEEKPLSDTPILLRLSQTGSRQCFELIQFLWWAQFMAMLTLDIRVSHLVWFFFKFSTLS